MPQATLLVIQGDDEGTRFHVGEETTGIGRGVRNELRILDTEVSRQHARLVFREGAFHVEDRDSSNGTFVNGKRVRRRALRNGDRIQVGRTVLSFNSTLPTSDDSPSVLEQVDLVGRGRETDRSSIVREIAPLESPLVLGPQSTVEEAPGLEQTLTNLQALYRISEEVVSASQSVDALLKRVLDLCIEVVGADRGSVLLKDTQTGEVTPHAFGYRSGSEEAGRMPVSRSIVDYVLDSGQGVRTSDAPSDQRFVTGQSILQAGIREAICVPVRGRYALTGVVYVDITTHSERTPVDESHDHVFTDDDLRLMLAIGRQCALAIENDHYQRAFVKAERLAAVGQTVATLSHHIKNILQGVRGGSYLIDRGLQQHEEPLVRKGWTIVERNQDRIYHLVMDMLTFSTERKPALKQASLNETVEDVRELAEARAEESGIELECVLGDHVPETYFDPEGIHRAVLNVLTNAVDALEGRPAAKIRLQTGFDEASDELFVCVADNGPGIPDDQLAGIFDAFESTKGARGTGLGLAVTRKIVREHGGDVTVESKPGQGCRFTLAWPRIDEDHLPDESATIA